MSDQTVRELAGRLKKPLDVDQLLIQLQEAGVSASSADDIINDEQQKLLLTHLRKRHGEGDNAPKRVTLERREVIEIKRAIVSGSSTKTTSVKVPKKKTYIKHADTNKDANEKEVFENAKVNTSKTIFVTDALENAVNLEQYRHAAIAIGSKSSFAKYYNKNRDENLTKSFVLIFDDNNEHIGALKNTIADFKSLGIKNYKIIFPPSRKTWNDLIVSGQLASDKIEKTLNKAYAESPLTYYYIVLKPNEDTQTLIFEFNNCIFKGYQKEIKLKLIIVDYEPKVELLVDCNIRLLYSVIDDSQDDKQRMAHYIELYSEQEGKGRIRLTAAELTRIGSFKVALQNHRQHFYGNSKDLTELSSYLFNTKTPKIRALYAIGYDDKSKGYYFPKFAYDADGQRIRVNDDNYFSDTNIKSFMDCNDTITSGLKFIDPKEFLKLFYTAYGHRGLLAFGFYVSSLFSHIVFEHYGFFPFLSLYGDPHTGKSFISKLLNRCFFIDSEGQTMTASNTSKGELRKISQKSGLVCALLEGRKNSRFDYDSILPLYNRNVLYSRATNSQDNRTHDLHLKATLSFVWNHECFTAKAAKERVISLHFSDTDNNESTRNAWIELNNYSPEQLASIGHHLLSNLKSTTPKKEKGANTFTNPDEHIYEYDFEYELIPEIKNYAEILKNDGISVPRIAENYAIALSGIICLIQSLELHINNEIPINDLEQYTIECARHKLETTKTQLHLADHFFESINGHYGSDVGVTLHNADELVIHLPTVLKFLKQSSNDFNENKRELIAELKRHDKFIAVKTTRCFDRPRFAYHFKKSALNIS